MMTETRILGTPTKVPEERSFAVTAGGLPKEIDNYTVVQAIGHGGMGSVFEVCHKTLGRRFALKLLSDSLRGNSEAVERFRSETSALGKLEHPNIVFAIDAGVWEGRPYLVTELIPGKDLSNFVAENGKMDVQSVISIATQLANALRYAHERGTFHRDIKSSNVIIQPDGIVKLLDFGLVRSESNRSMTQAGGFMGTVDFVSPEQAGNASQAGAASDIYSLGCTLIHLLSGELPFPDNRYASLIAKLRAHLLETPEWLIRPENDAPTWLISLIQSMVAKRASDRPASCQEIHACLQQHQFSVPVCTSRSALGNITQGYPRVKKWAVVLGMAIVLTACGWFVVVNGQPIAQAATDSEAKLDEPKTVDRSKATRPTEKTLSVTQVQNAPGFALPNKTIGKRSARPTAITTQRDQADE